MTFWGKSGQSGIRKGTKGPPTKLEP
ncbi:hypothetical protein CCACVL1_26662 [Corchorus capsularis]|uniref:Uncharacterized protein n=1 Tax=Corchorus capsularis TaxID=210143 RepID=A0A1R3GE72_COCAP|nr:hypothetical protein CCACVL1_26662 [Corchorus capsularis]